MEFIAYNSENITLIILVASLSREGKVMKIFIGIFED